jgi:SAM-dependent methyltransferase
MSPGVRGLIDGILGRRDGPAKEFHSDAYQRHNHRRLEHLASLGLDLAGSSVLEVGAGIGDHTSFFLDRGCRVVSGDARADNVAVLRARHPQIEVHELDLDEPPAEAPGAFDVVYCYGLLYHLTKPAEAIEFMARCCRRLLLLETCVSFGDDESVNPCVERVEVPSQSVRGRGCRPTRPWVFNALRRHFEHVYMPTTQPWHEEFPLDWTGPAPHGRLTRAVFVASRSPMENAVLVERIPAVQARH